MVAACQLWPPPSAEEVFHAEKAPWVGLAPMVRANTPALRVLALEYGADAVYSEELVARRLMNTTRVVNNVLGTVDFVNQDSKTIALRVASDEERGRLVVQIGCSDTASAFGATQMVGADCAGVDLNMGCPKSFSTQGGMGSALMSDPSRAADILKAMRRAAPSDVAISAKIRLSECERDSVDLCRALRAAGAQAIAVHCRRVDEQPPAYSPRLSEQRSLFARLRAEFSEFRQCSLLANGDFYTKQAIQDVCRGEGAADGVILARPALLNCSIFAVVKRSEPVTFPRLVVLRDYALACRRFDAHHVNMKYVIMEMLGKRRHPKHALALCSDVLPQHITIAEAGKRKSVDSLLDLVFHSDAVPPARRPIKSMNHTALPDSRRYDDAYFACELNQSPTEVAQLNRNVPGDFRPVKTHRWTL